MTSFWTGYLFEVGMREKNMGRKLEMGTSFDLFAQFYCGLSLQVFLLF